MSDNLGKNPFTKLQGTNPENIQKLIFGLYCDRYASESEEQIDIDDVFVVWYMRSLGNSKALVSTKRPDGRYFEVTYSSEKDTTYVDVYTKVTQLRLEGDQNG